MNRHLFSLATMVFGGLVWAQPADAAVGKRVALVLGNSAYQNVAKLPNPSNDANAIGKMLKDAGFEVILRQDVGSLEFKRAIRSFGDAMADADIALVFYAGHGIEVKGTNYLIPIDAKLARDRDAEDEAVSLDRLTQEIENAGGRAKQLRLIILDACRDNPFLKTMKQSGARSARTRSASAAGGLNAIQPAGSDMLIAYAAKQGSTAEDGDGDHSPFTAALLRSLTVPGLDVRLAFGRVRDDVLKATANKQEPFVYGSLGGGVIPLVPSPQQASTATTDEVTIKSDYDRVAKIGTKKAFEVFVGNYKTGFYAELARAQIEELNNLDHSKLASLPAPPSKSDRPSTEETRAWAGIEGSTDIAKLRNFIDRYPNSPLAITAQSRIDLLQRSAREREAKAAAEREASQRAKAEVARLKAEQEAAAKRVADERRAKAAAEAERQRLDREAARQREDDARRAAAAKTTAERQAIEAAAKAAEDERRAKAAELDRLASEREAALKREEAVKSSKEAELNVQVQRAEEERKASIETERSKTASDQVALLSTPTEKPPADAATPELITAAQKQLTRLGCYSGNADGAWNDATRSALRRYHLQQGRLPSDVSVNASLLSDLERQKSPVCPLVCQDGSVSNGEICIAKEKSKASPAVANKDRDRDDRRERQSRSKPAQSKPQARREASRSSHGGGGRSGGSVSGMGF